MQLSRVMQFVGALAIVISVGAPERSTAQEAAHSANAGNTGAFQLWGSAQFGLGEIKGASFIERGKTNLEFTVGLQRKATTSFNFLAGVAAGGMLGPAGHDLVCYLDANGVCMKPAPDLQYGALLAGIEAHKGIASISALAGAGAAYLTGDGGNDDRRSAVIGLYRVDVLVAVASHVKVGLTGSTRVFSSYSRERLYGNAVSAGVRLHR